ncbi:MAG: MFS transporter [Halieaceae bacterium]|nr:MFS transporter [Halieaceae bacterium]
MHKTSAKEKWTYAIGNVPLSVKEAAFSNFVVFFYTQVNGLNGTLAGLAMFAALLWDAISDPLVGSYSDTFQSRWGRRHPLMAAGILPSAFLLLALFDPPSHLGDVGMFLWLLAISVLLRTALTIYAIPYTALGAEISDNYDERTQIATARITLAWIAGMTLPAIAYTFLFTDSANGISGRLEASNYWIYGVLSTVVAAITGIICIVGTRTLIPKLPQGTTGLSFRWLAPYHDLKLIGKNRNFRISIGSNLAFGMCTGGYATLSLYLSTYYWELTSFQLAGLVLPTALATLIAFSALGLLNKHYDKPTLLAGFSLGLILNATWLFGGRLIDILPSNHEPSLYFLICLNTCIGVVMIVGLQVISASFAADLIDEIELQTGHRKEGVLFSVSAFLNKVTIGAGALIAGIVVDLSGITIDARPGEVASDTLQTLGLLTLILVSGFAFIGFLFTKRLQLSRSDHRAIRLKLDTNSSKLS